jgi:hypothetical protein
LSLFANQSRDALRGRYVDAWRRHRAGLPLEPLDAQIVDVIAEHPEYHALLAREGAVPNDFPAESTNPFLHMSLHLALREQVSTNRPTGIAAIHHQLSRRFGSAHAAEHRMMEVLAAALWEAQRRGAPGDEETYLERLRQLRPGTFRGGSDL